MANDGKWIQTYQGQAFWPVAPDRDHVDIIDIAHSLALSCRWTGHVRKHFSVAQHSLFVSYLVPEQFALEALLHDASEAYISDIARPTKPQLANYYEIEERLMREVWHRFGVKSSLSSHDLVKEADNALLTAEARDLMRAPPMPWTYVCESRLQWKSRLRPWPMWYAEFRFLWRFGGLTKSRWATMKRWVKSKFDDFKYFTLGMELR
jgi:hypothetical protein